MFAEKKYVFIFALCFLTTLLSYSHPGAQEVSKKRLSDQRKAGSTQEKAPSEKQPKITIDTTLYDAGKVDEGDRITHTFTVKNTGTAELTIKDVKPG